MRRAIRIPVWYVLPLVVVGLVAYLVGNGRAADAVASGPAMTTTLTATITRVLTQTVTHTVLVAAPTEPPRLAAAVTEAPATDTPAPTPSPVPATATPAPPTPTSVPTASPTALPPTATAKPTATSAPTITATPPAFLRVGQTWQQDGMSLQLITSARSRCCDETSFDFQTENHTNAILNFDLAANDISVQFSGGKQYAANGTIGFNGLAPDDKENFTIVLNVDWGAFQALERDLANSYYTITVAHFSSHITNAKWRVDLAH